MNLTIILYGIAGLLSIYIVVSIAATRKFSLGDAIALLGLIVSVLLAINTEKKQYPIVDTSSIAGTWAGTIISDTDDFSAEIELFIQTNCSAGNICGTYSVNDLGCSGDLTLIEIEDGIFYFREQKVNEYCGGGVEKITLLSDDSIAWVFLGETAMSHANLSRK